MRYKEAFKDLPVSMNPYDESCMEPNFWLSCMIIDKDAMCEQVRTDSTATYVKEKGKSCPTEILETLAKYNAEGRPIWKPMHMQPLYAGHDFVNCDGCDTTDVGADIFARGLCLPSDIKMTDAEQDMVIEIVKSCFC
jgi:dTDP-4-amino-4,6-dideoxygalactose transaminase